MNVDRGFLIALKTQVSFGYIDMFTIVYVCFIQEQKNTGGANTTTTSLTHMNLLSLESCNVIDQCKIGTLGVNILLGVCRC